MFRGGSTNNKMSGIMSGIKDTPRRQYAEAGNVKSFEDLVSQSPRLGELKIIFQQQQVVMQGKENQIYFLDY